jgi:hypothetical protein
MVDSSYEVASKKGSREYDGTLGMRGNRRVEKYK